MRGLSYGHGWDRGARVVLSHSAPGIGEYTVAVAWVTQAYTNAAKVHIIVQDPSAHLPGANAKVVSTDEIIRLNKHYARITHSVRKTVTLDRGRDDGVEKGDTYEIHANDPPDLVVGKLRVTEVAPASASAVIEEGRSEIRFEATFSGRARPRDPVTLLLLAPYTEGPDDVQTQMAMRADGHVRRALESAKREAPEFRIIEGSPTWRGESTLEQVHERAVQQGHLLGADHVLITQIRCGEWACMDNWLITPGDISTGTPARAVSLDLSPSQVGEAPPSSLVLGELTHAMRNYQDASYYFRHSIPQDDSMSNGARRKLAEADVELGQAGRARSWLVGKNLSTNADLLAAHAAVACGDPEQNELVALKDMAKAASRTSNSLEARQVWDKTLGCLVDTNSERHEVIDPWLTEGRDLAEQDMDGKKRIEWMTRDAHALYRAGKYSSGMRMYQSTYSLAQERSEPRAMTKIRIAEARDSLRVGEPLVAEERLHDAMQTSRISGHPEDCIECFDLLSTARFYRYGAKEAAFHMQKLCLDQPQALQLPCKISLSSLKLLGGTGKEILPELERLTRTARSTQQPKLELDGLELTATHEIALGRISNAHKSVEEACRLALNLDPGRGQLLIARLKFVEGSLISAAQNARNARDSFRDNRDQVREAWARLLLGDISYAQGRRGDANSEVENARQTFLSLGEHEGRRQAELALALYALQEGKTDPAAALQSVADEYSRNKSIPGQIAAKAPLMWANIRNGAEPELALRALGELERRARMIQHLKLRADVLLWKNCVLRSLGRHAETKGLLDEARRLYFSLGQHQPPQYCADSA